MSTQVHESWVESGGVRHPTTLKSPAQEELEVAQADKATATAKAPQPAQSITEQSAIAAYLPSMRDSIYGLTRKEQLCHKTAAKKEPAAMKEHLERFYIKFEQEMADCLQIHANYICSIQGKEKFTSDKLLFMSKDICHLEKTEEHPDNIVEMLCNELCTLDDLASLGEIRQGDDGHSYMNTITGWEQVNVV